MKYTMKLVFKYVMIIFAMFLITGGIFALKLFSFGYM